VGAHAAEDCEACHLPQPQGARKWVGLPIECVACHRVDYESTTDPDPRPGAVPHRVPAVPHADLLGEGALRSCRHAVPPDRGPSRSRLRGLPRERIRGNADGLLRLPRGRLPRDDRSRSRAARLSDRLHGLPLDERLGRRRLHPARHAVLPDLLRAARRSVEPVAIATPSGELRIVQLFPLPLERRHRPEAHRRTRLRLRQQPLLPVPPAGRSRGEVTR